MKLLLCTPATARARQEAAFAAALPEAQLLWRDAADTTVQQHADQADAAVLWRPPAAVFAEQRALRAVFNFGAGVDALLALPGLPHDLPIYRLEDAGMAAPMARYVLAAVLRHELRFDAYARAQAESRWVPQAPRGAALAVGVLGAGAIGGVIASTLAAAGYAVRAYSRSPRHIAGVECHAGEALPQFLRGLDVLVNVLPLTADTAGLINAALLAQLAPGAHLVNVGRGAVVAEADLLAALDSGQLAGATLDVFATEPLPPDHIFWRHPAILVTPHVSGLTDVEAGARQIAGKLRAIARGEAVSGRIDRQRGY